jgi:hypothetical protein
VTAVGTGFCWFLAAVLTFGWSRLCFGAWTARHTTPATASEED